MTPSSRKLNELPQIEALRRLMQSLAMLDAIICPEWEYRYYSFNARWSDGEMLGSMRNGSGDNLFVAFNSHGCFIKGFAHESLMSPYQFDSPRVFPGVLEQVPVEFSEFVDEPAFVAADTTFCFWRRFVDPVWMRGEIQFPDGENPDGSRQLLSLLDCNPDSYKVWADAYYELTPPLSLVDTRRIYDHDLLTREFALSINPECVVDHLAADAKEIGYPHSL